MHTHVYNARIGIYCSVVPRKIRGIDMIKNGRPYSIENGYEDADLITDHSETDQHIVMDWIVNNLVPRKTVLYESSSYGLKHILERDTGIYLTNNEFKDAMLLAGFEPANPNDINWYYRISKKSPAFSRRFW